MRVLCFDIGGTNVKYGVIENEQFIEKGLFDTEAQLGKEVLDGKLVKIAKEMKEKYQIEGIGISCAGSVNFEKAYISIAPDALPTFSDWDFRKLFIENVGLDCIADNDVNSFAKAECVKGAAEDYDHFIVITIGTGIGGAIVMNDEIWRGKNYNAGEVGRVLIGNAKWESVASTSALIKDDAKGSVILTATKTIKVADGFDHTTKPADGEFTFDLKDAAGNVLDTAKNDANGKVSFTREFQLSDLDGAASKDFTYTIVEQPGAEPGMVYDSHPLTYTVTVTDGGNGALNAKAIVTSASGSDTFTNT